MEVERCSFTPCATTWQPLPNGLSAPSRVTALAVLISGYGGAAFLLWGSGISVMGEQHFCYGGAAFGLLRQKYRPPVTEYPLAPCRNRAVGNGAKHPGTTTLPTRGRTIFPHTGSFPHILIILFSFLFYRLKLKIPMLGIYGCGKCA